MGQPIEVEVGDEIVEFPFGTTDETIQRVLAENYPAPQGMVGNAIDSVQESAGAVGDALAPLPGQAVESVTQGLEDYTTQINNIPGSENPVTAAANVVRPGLEIMGDVGAAGVETWKQTWGKHPLFDNDIVRSGVEAVKNSDIASSAMAALTSGYDKWMDR